ncbi:MAG: DUF2264 domain-containing protein [Faecalibacterium sp.]
MNLHSKQDFAQLAKAILAPLPSYYSQGGARVCLGATNAAYTQNAVEVEGFSRPLWALGPLWLGGETLPEFAALYQKGLANGSDPAHPEYWGSTHTNDQCFVEMAAIACAILEAPEVVWTPLSAEAKQNLAAWLGSINTNGLPVCNWLFFRVLVNLALHSVNMPCDMAQNEADLNEMETWYQRDGWYSDGALTRRPQRDYYVPFALQYYAILYSVYAAELDPVRAERYRRRAKEFGAQFATWFDTDGAAMPFGRSLTYRFAQCAFYSACVFAGIDALPLAQMKGIITRNFTWWMNADIFDASGLLTLGYRYPQLYMTEHYNAPGSPYWGLKSFLFLGLPDEHPFWQIKAEPLACTPDTKALYGADMLMQRGIAGDATLYASGIVQHQSYGQFPEKYAKFAYNTRFGFCTSRSYSNLEQAAPDSMLAFEIDEYIFVRRWSDDFALKDDRCISKWSPFAGITVTTELIPCENGHIRKHSIESNIPCRAYDCGYAVPERDEIFSPCATTPAWHAAYDAIGGLGKGNKQPLSSRPQTIPAVRNATDGFASAQCLSVACSVKGDGEGKVFTAFTNTNLYHTNTVIPCICYDIPAGHCEIETLVTTTFEA